MKLLKQEVDSYIVDTIDFMNKVDENFRKEIFSHARFLYREYQEELKQKQKENQRLQIVKDGGKV